MRTVPLTSSACLNALPRLRRLLSTCQSTSSDASLPSLAGPVAHAQEPFNIHASRTHAAAAAAAATAL